MAKSSDAPAPMADAPCVPRRRSAPVGGGGGGSDSDTEIEAPKKPRSAAQIAAFEKARERLAQSKAERAAAKSKQCATPETRPKPEAPVPEAVPQDLPKARKPRSDKGKRRGTLRRTWDEDLEDTACSAPPPSHTPAGCSQDGMYRRHGQFIVV
jgi:hypothetical protein